jgi:hypothetical protein
MHAGFADHVMHEGHVICTGPEWCHGLAEHLPALTIRFEVPNGLLPRAEAVLKGLHRLAEVRLLAVMLDESGFEIKEVDVRCRAAHEELHDAFRLRCDDLRAVLRLRRLHRGKGERAETLSGGLQKLAAGEHD